MQTLRVSGSTKETWIDELGQTMPEQKTEELAASPVIDRFTRTLPQIRSGMIPRFVNVH